MVGQDDLDSAARTALNHPQMDRVAKVGIRGLPVGSPLPASLKCLRNATLKLFLLV